MTTPATPTAPQNHGAARAASMRANLESMRKQAQGAKDIGAVGAGRQAASARDFLAKQLGKPTGPVQGTSVARMGSRGASGFAPGSGFALPPKLPGGK